MTIAHQIDSIQAIEILDSRGFPTIGCWVTSGDYKAFSAIPSGASCGQHEAYELRDADLSRYNGKGCQQAIRHIHEIIQPKLLGFPVSPRKIDYLLRSLDESSVYSNIGANAVLSVSMAVYKLYSTIYSKSLYESFDINSRFKLPIPLFNVINGGCHASNNIDIQEFMLVPTAFDTFKDSLRCGSEVFHALKKLLLERNFPISVGDEGGFAPNFDTVDEVFQLMTEAVECAGYQLHKHVSFAIDFASSEFYDGKRYRLSGLGKTLTTNQWIDQIKQWVDRYPIILLEDPIAEDDYDGWLTLTRELGSRLLLVGDDLLVTQAKRLQRAIDDGLCNSILIKPNQVGTISQTLETIDLAKQHKFDYVISHRSGETEDTFISDLAVGTGANYIKAGSLNRSERLAKYNRLLQIEHELSSVDPV
ncbi:MAG: phosphopyruvate hydratase [Legionellales bacterium]|nr:phosphopyruvate hydratase [Legionellales bacterium]